MEPDAALTPALEAQLQDIERWLNSCNPAKLFESMLYELVQHFGIVGDTFRYVSEDKKGRLARLDDVTPNQAGSARPVASQAAACAVLSRVMRTTSITSQVTASLHHE